MMGHEDGFQKALLQVELFLPGAYLLKFDVFSNVKGGS